MAIGIQLDMDFELYEELQRYIGSNNKEDWQETLQELLWKALEVEHARTNKQTPAK